MDRLTRTRLSLSNLDDTATFLFVVGLTIVACNSALYFFGVESLSHPVVSVLALGLLVPLYRD
ncbi:hypothetical protein [Halorussus halophilus]|uniref:hypothetical protein n=1 Tax=Halorussus halophilus TaxID=2650975 RepID=UPI0013017542|nr:hypothetical protein [Halorussus halophilus]